MSFPRGFYWMILALVVVATAASAAPTKNGFDLSNALVPVAEILPGGPPRDGIPAIDRPRFDRAADTDAVAPEDFVLGVNLNGEVKAYPLRIMNWHEIVNDRFGATRVVVTYCPLCGTGLAFLADIEGRPVEFGVSGLLYNSDMLLYDRDSESLWSQIEGRAISGRHTGQRLIAVPLEHTTWEDWRRRHPETLVLSQDTGHARDYGRDPYAGYTETESLHFPVKFRAQGYHPKERVLGLELNERFKAYPFSELARTGGEVHDEIGGHRVTIRFDAANQNATARDAAGEPMPGVVGFWFAWFAFHPETEVFKATPATTER